MNAEQLLISMLERILEKQDQLLEKSIGHTHAIAKVTNTVSEVNDRLNVLESADKNKRKGSVEVQKTWIPVVLKIIEVLALFIGALLGINAVL